MYVLCAEKKMLLFIGPFALHLSLSDLLVLKAIRAVSANVISVICEGKMMLNTPYTLFVYL